MLEAFVGSFYIGNVAKSEQAATCMIINKYIFQNRNCFCLGYQTIVAG